MRGRALRVILQHHPPVQARGRVRCVCGLPHLPGVVIRVVWCSHRTQQSEHRGLDSSPCTCAWPWVYIYFRQETRLEMYFYL